MKVFIFGSICFGCAESSWLCAGFSSSAERGLLPGCSVLVFLFSVFCCSLQALSTSVAVAQGLGCPQACGISPHQGLNPCPLHWQADSEPLDHQGSASDPLSPKFSENSSHVSDRALELFICILTCVIYL